MAIHLGRCPGGDYALTRPCCLRRSERIAVTRDTSDPRVGAGYADATVWTPRGFAGSIRTLGPIVEETAKDLM